MPSFPNMFRGMLFAFSVTSENISAFEVYFDSVSFGYSETSAIDQIAFDGFEGPIFKGGENSFTHNRWELGASVGRFKLAGLLRYDYDTHYTPDTAFLVYADENDIPLELDRDYEVYIKLSHARTKGLKLGYALVDEPKQRLSIDFSYLETTSYIEGYAKGMFSASDDDTYSGNALVDYVYDKDRLLERPELGPDGSGYAIDINWNYHIDDNLLLDLEVIDLWSKITIDDALFTRARAISDRVSLEDDGTLDVKPLLSGTEGKRRETLRFPTKTSLSLDYRLLPDLNLVNTWYEFGNHSFFHLGFRKQLASGLNWLIQYEVKSSSVHVGIASHAFSASIMSDHFDLTEAQSFGLGLSYRVELD